jgi:hypothetical protein
MMHHAQPPIIRRFKRSEVASGLYALTPVPIPWQSDKLAPFCVVPVILDNLAVLPTMMKEALWVFYCLKYFIELKIEVHAANPCSLSCSTLTCATHTQGAYMDGQGTLVCQHNHASKTVICDTLSPDINEPVNELDVQVRFMRCEDPANAANFLNVAFVVASTPAAFSIAHALWAVLHRPNVPDIETIRDCLTRLRMHMAPSTDLQDHETAMHQATDTCMNWFASPGNIITTFSSHSALQWTGERFFESFPDSNSCQMAGFPLMARDDVYFTPSMRGEYHKYATDATANARLNNKKNAKRPRKPNAEPEEAAKANHPVPEIPLTAQDRGFLSDQSIETGLPAARNALRITLLPGINGHKSLDDFSEQLPIFPTCVAASEGDYRLLGISPELSSEEARLIISGSEVRPLLSCSSPRSA